MSRKRRDEHRVPAIENRPYDAQGSKAEAEAADKDDGFRRGGKAKARKRKRGGAAARARRADGARPHARADKPRRARRPLADEPRGRPEDAAGHGQLGRRRQGRRLTARLGDAARRKPGRVLAGPGRSRPIGDAAQKAFLGDRSAVFGSLILHRLGTGN